MTWPNTEDDYMLSMNKIWVLTCGAMIFSMQIGFAFLEAGSIRKKNQSLPFYRIMLHSLFGVLSYWLVGYAFSYGDAYNNFIGGKNYFGNHNWDQPNNSIDETTQYANWMFQYCVAIVTVAIANGSITERTTLLASTIHAFLMVGFIYPIVVAWTWGGGWLSQQGFIDFSGVGIVHTTGAFSGLAGVIFVGSRYNRWDEYEDVLEDSPLYKHKNFKKDTKELYSNDIEPNLQESPTEFINFASLRKLRNKVNNDDYEYFGVTNITYTLFGGIFLWVGFIFYNAGSTLGLLKTQNELWRYAEYSAVNTFIGGCSAGLFSLIFRTPISRNGCKWR